MSASAALDQMKSLVRAKGLEDEFLKSAGLTSLDELSPKNFADLQPDVPPTKTTTVTVADAGPVPAPEMKKKAADAPPPSMPTSASDMLSAYLGTKILYASRKKLSHYWPSAIMMYHIIHLMNSLLVDNFYFKRHCPDYHPYILRLYFGILFYIQTLRAGQTVNALDAEQHEYLTRFLANFPADTLPIPGPLIALFKTICSSQPEISAFGKVFPLAPAQPGPALRSSFTANSSFILAMPQIPAIFALLQDLNAKINAANPTYPKKGKHDPVGDVDVTFGYHAFPAAAARSAHEKWSLVCSGLEYPCEADAKLNEAFAERYENFDFPATAAADDISDYYGFTSMRTQMSWFSTVVDVATSAALYFEGSGTLADCSPSGVVSNQIQVVYSTPATLPTAPTKVADKASRFPFAFRLSTSARSLPALAEALAANAQTHIRMFPTHPFSGNYGDQTARIGQFWNVRPLERSSEDEESVNAIPGIIKKMMKSRV
jgi:hypothetical protein